MKKKIILGLMISVLSLPVVFGQENLSPIESIVEWGETEESLSETTEQVESSQSTEFTEDSEVLEIPEEEISTEVINLDGTPTNLPEVTSAQELLKVVGDQRSDLSSNYYLINLNMGQMTLVGKALVSSQEGYYLTFQNPPFIPITVLVEENQKEVVKQYVPLKAMIAYFSDAINQYPEIYSGTIVEEFYIYAQENHEKLADKYIEIDDQLFQTTPMFQEAKALDSYWLEVLNEFFENYSQDFEFESANGVETIVVQDELAQKFTEIADSKQDNYPELKNVFELFETGLEGTLSFNYDRYEIGIGLLSFVNESMTNGIEYYIQPVQPDIKQPDSEEIISLATFNEEFGKNLFEELDNLNQTLSPDQFESGE